MTPFQRDLLSILTPFLFSISLTFLAEHGGLKEDGTPDKRVGTGEFAQGQVDPHEAGKAGGQTSGTTGSTGSTGTSTGSSSGGSAKGGMFTFLSKIIYSSKS